MDLGLPKFSLDDGLSLRELQTTGSTLHINEIYNESDYGPDAEPTKVDHRLVDFLGSPVKDFTVLARNMVPVDSNGFVKKNIIEEGGGMPLHDGCTVSIAFSGYWENALEPFDAMSLKKPLEVDLKDNGLLPGLEMAVRSMLVGETAVFLLSHNVMYGELGIPPRIKPKATCMFYVKLIKSILTPKETKINYSEPNMFDRVRKEVIMLYTSGYTLYKSSNYNLATHLFRKAVTMLHKCRLADENEERNQEKLLKKLYINLAICYVKTKQPLKACTVCNELNRFKSLWNNGKALLQNAKALRMIGQYDAAEKRLLRALKLCPDSKEMEEELELLQNTKESCNQSRLISQHLLSFRLGTVNNDFKQEVDLLIKNFKENVNLCKLTLPTDLTSDEMAYVKSACIRDNLFFNRIPNNCAETNEETPRYYAVDKENDSYCDLTSVDTQDDQVFDLDDNLAVLA